MNGVRVVHRMQMTRSAWCDGVKIAKRPDQCALNNRGVLSAAQQARCEARVLSMVTVRGDGHK